MKKIIDGYEAMQEFIEPLIAEDKWFIDIRRIKGTDQYSVEWQEHKEYITHDGKTFRDEVWITKDNVPYFVQDLTEAHAKNILRMLLREGRQRAEVIDQVKKTLEDALGGNIVLEGLEDQVDELFPKSALPNSKPTLH